ncbi:alpha/beta fold hydrolase [Halorubrum sp. GN11_10-6_MGM]|uniref:alpha/beta hydrolase n=1 Tax=Halorubrum sp. GN11_10-6_MGM TaxID=2518112 RepID=UPI0010F6F1D7|nr:alpha/beta fold hydrolase [Halorubrum sp. GN11_10-6_MGM]TKX74173.1 alpha/beta fold hydrolase [Halorubrum sp. GN11_10-6_MGM]
MTRRDPINRAQRRLARPPRERFATRAVAFDVGGATCRGTLYLPGGDADDPPVVVMAPGLGAERSFGYPAVAERFADAGYAALLFDHPEFGDSDGDSQAVDLARQRAAYEGAIDRARRVDDAGDALVLWGASLSAAHVLTLAAERRDVDAVVGLVPMLDGRAIALRRGGKYLARAGAAGLRDLLGHRIGRGRTVPIVGDPEECAAITEPGAERKYIDLVDRESAWRNETPARSLLGLPRYRPVTRFDDIDAPTLLLAGTDDAIVDAESVAAAGESLSRGTVVTMPADHFSVLGDDFEGAIGHQLSFLKDALE